MKKPAEHGWVAVAMVAAALAVGAAPTGMAQATPAKPHSAAAAEATVPRMPRFRFENFTKADGLPDDHVYSVLVDGDRIWAGTDNGLGVYEGGKWKVYSTQRRPGAPGRALAAPSTGCPAM